MNLLDKYIGYILLAFFVIIVLFIGTSNVYLVSLFFWTTLILLVISKRSYIKSFFKKKGLDKYIKLTAYIILGVMIYLIGYKQISQRQHFYATCLAFGALTILGILLRSNSIKKLFKKK